MTKAHRLEHLEVVHRALFESLSLEQLVLFVVVEEALLQLCANALTGLLNTLLSRDVMTRRIDHGLFGTRDDFPAQGIDLCDRVDLISEELDANGELPFVLRKNLDDVAANTERTAMEIMIISGVLHVDQTTQQIVAIECHARLDIDVHRPVILGRAQAVNTRHTRDHEYIFARQQRMRCGVPELVDLIVDRRVLLYVGIRRREIGFGLVVVVVRDEILDRVMREEFLELFVELRGECLIRRHHQGRAIQSLDHARNRKSLATSGHTQQGLMLVPAEHALAKCIDRRRLIPCRFVFRNELKGVFEAAAGHGRSIDREPRIRCRPALMESRPATIACS